MRGRSCSSTEARVFQSYLLRRTIPTKDEVEICNCEEYLGGLMDFVGELNRFAVLAATQRDKAAVEHARETAERVQVQLMKFDFRNGNLRRKYDGIKYSVKKMEQIIYEMSLTDAMGGLAVERGMDDDDGGEPGAGERPAKRARGDDA